MATEFKILRGNKSTLIDENGVCLIQDKLVNGYWYLTNDTAEVFVCLEIEGNLVLKKINECNIDTDLDLDSFETRLQALEAERTHVYGYKKDFFNSTGIQDHIYIAEDEHRTYIWTNGRYVHIADNFETEDDDNDPETPEVRIIYGGSAN